MENATTNPPLQNLPGLIWRPIDRDDLAALIELTTECLSVDGGLPFITDPEDLMNR